MKWEWFFVGEGGLVCFRATLGRIGPLPGGNFVALVKRQGLPNYPRGGGAISHYESGRRGVLPELMQMLRPKPPPRRRAKVGGVLSLPDADAGAACV